MSSCSLDPSRLSGCSKKRCWGLQSNDGMPFRGEASALRWDAQMTDSGGREIANSRASQPGARSSHFEMIQSLGFAPASHPQRAPPVKNSSRECGWLGTDYHGATALDSHPIADEALMEGNPLRLGRERRRPE